MINNKRILILILIFTLIGFLLRFYNLTKNPNSLSIDEVAYGYSAYSILKTGHDENGVFMPLTFKSTGDYKSPVLIYSLVPSIALFGLNEFAVRFTTALLGVFTIPVFFLLVLSITKIKNAALVGSLLLAISPWHIYYSRFASESLMGLFFLILGMWFFQKMYDGRWLWGFISAITLVIAVYSYHSLRLFIPLFIPLLIFVYFKKRKLPNLNLIVFLFTLLILALPLMYQTIFGGANTRTGMVFLANDIDYTRYVVLDHLYNDFNFKGLSSFLLPLTIFSNENLLLFFFWVKRFFNYFQPDFLFMNGLNMTSPGSIGLGVLFLFQLPWLVLGIISLIKERLVKREIIFLWVLLGIMPASLTNNEQSSVRSLIILPMLILIISIGATKSFEILRKFKPIARVSVIAAYCIMIFINLTSALLIFSVHFPKQRGEAFMEGTKESIIYAINHKNEFREIVYDPYRGIEAPYIVNIPYMYILFYSKYDPFKYQTENKRSGNDLYSFDKFTIRKIDWRIDRSKTDTLFIGSPWSLPEKDIKREEVLEKIYLASGDLALLVVAPKPNLE